MLKKEWRAGDKERAIAPVAREEAEIGESRELEEVRGDPGLVPSCASERVEAERVDGGWVGR